MEQRDQRTDLDLVAAVNAGDAGAFEELYFRHRDWVAGLARRFTGDPEVALDVLQETFIYFLRKFPGFELRANLKTFLFPAVRNLSIQARRKRDRSQSTGEELAQLEMAVAPPEAAVQTDALTLALQDLSEDHRETLLLRFVEGFDLQEIAQAMDAPLGTVKSRLHHALATLRSDPRTRLLFEE